MLVGCVSAIAEIENGARTWREWTSILKPERCPSFPFERVAILQSAVDVDIPSCRDNIRDFGCGKRSPIPYEFADLASGTYGRRVDHLQRRDNKGVLVGRLNDCNLCPIDVAVRGRLASVFECKSYAWLISMVGVWGIENGALKQTAAFRKNIGSQLPSGIAHHHNHSRDKSHKLQECDDACDYRDFVTQAPRGIQRAYLVFHNLSRFCRAIWDGQHLDDKGRLFGSALFWGGILSAGSGFR